MEPLHFLTRHCRLGPATIRKRCLTHVVTALWSVEAPVKICSRVFRFGQSLRTSSDRLHNATKGGSHCNNNVQFDPRSSIRPKEKLDRSPWRNPISWYCGSRCWVAAISNVASASSAKWRQLPSNDRRHAQPKLGPLQLESGPVQFKPGIVHVKRCSL